MSDDDKKNKKKSTQGNTSERPKKKKHVTASLNDDGTYNVDGDRAEREGTKDDVKNKRLNKQRNSVDDKTVTTKARVLDDPVEDDDDEPTAMERLKSVSWREVFVIGALPALIVGVMAGCMFGGDDDPAPQKPETQTARSIEGVHGVLDKVETLKDKQILAQRKMMASMQEKGRGSLTQEEFGAISRLNKDVVGTLDPFFNAVIGIKRDAKDDELASQQKQLSDRTTDRASTSRLYDFLHGPTPAKQLGRDVSKSGPVMPSWIGSSNKGTRTYSVLVPLVTEKSTLKAHYVVTLMGDKIDGISYNGIVLDNEMPVEGELAKQLTGDPNKADMSKPKDPTSSSSSLK